MIGTTPSGLTPPGSSGRRIQFAFAVGRVAVVRVLRAVLEDHFRQVDVGVEVVVLAAPLLQARQPLRAVAGSVGDDHLGRVLDRYARVAAVRVHEQVGAADLDRLGMEQHRGGVEVVALPDVPGGRVGLLVLAEAKARDLEALDRGVDDDLAPVVGERAEQAAEHVAELLGREAQAVVAVEVALVEAELALVLGEAPVE
jgi:hypothetical protein